MRQRALQIVPYAWDVSKILRLAIALLKSREDAEDLRRALRRQRRIGLNEVGRNEVWIEIAPRPRVTAEQRHLKLLRHVDARVLQERGEIVGCRPHHRILEIEQADARGALALRQPND